MPELPTGTVTFLFTDNEGSTTLWEREPDAMQSALLRHDAVIERAVVACGGTIIKSRGEGDSLFAVFARASDALSSALRAQRALLSEQWSLQAPLRVRMAIHTGET